MDIKIGDIKQGSEIGKTPVHNYVWYACEKCGKERWVKLKRGIARSPRCQSCSKLGNKRAFGKHWYKNNSYVSYGYVYTRLSPDDTFYPMVDKNGFVREHRLVMAKSLNRFLTKQEAVHHKNGVRDDNRIENLELISPVNHHLKTAFCNQCPLRKDIRLIQLQNKLLLEQVRELNLKFMDVKKLELD